MLLQQYHGDSCHIGRSLFGRKGGFPLNNLFAEATGSIEYI